MITRPAVLFLGSNGRTPKSVRFQNKYNLSMSYQFGVLQDLMAQYNARFSNFQLFVIHLIASSSWPTR